MPRSPLLVAVLTGCAYLGPNTLDRDGDGTPDPEDCNHHDANATSERSVFVDADGDGFGDPGTRSELCGPVPPGKTLDGTDCDDDDAAIHPDRGESCATPYDDNCDGEVTAPAATLEGALLIYDDADADGAVVDRAPATACAALAGQLAVVPGEASPPIDCDDTDFNIRPGVIDTPHDGIDQDCSGADDIDADDDGYPGAQSGGPDCDDDNAAIHPGAVEDWTDAVDENCDGNGTDRDGDGSPSCAFAAPPCDCDDEDTARSPLATEDAGGEDLDCDGHVGEACRVDADNDGAGYGLSFVAAGCGPGTVSATLGALDCDDTDSSLSPGAVDLPYDGIDQDCSGADIVDVDGDGFAGLDGGGWTATTTTPGSTLAPLKTGAMQSTRTATATARIRMATVSPRARS